MGWRNICNCLLCKSQVQQSNKSHQKQEVTSEGNGTFIGRFVESKIFMPGNNRLSRNLVISPASFALPHEPVVMCTKDGVNLMGYLLLQTNQPHQNLPTVIMYHGNGGNIGDCIPIADKFYQLNCNVLLVEYRGFGLSEGIPTEQGVYLDAQASVDYVLHHTELDSSKIVIYGISLGGAIAIDLAARHNYKDRIAAIIVENTFSSLDAVATQLVPSCLSPLVKYLELEQKFASYLKIRLVDQPILFVTGLKDNFIAPTHTTKLYSECGSSRKWILEAVDGAHLNTWNQPEYLEGIHSFLLTCFPDLPSPESDGDGGPTYLLKEFLALSSSSD